MLLKRGENGQAGLPCRLIAGGDIEIGADAALGEGPVRPQRSVP